MLFSYVYLQYRNQCFCGNGEKLNSSQYPSKKETDCNMPCIGHVKQICGGSWRARVYKINHNGEYKCCSLNFLSLFGVCIPVEVCDSLYFIATNKQARKKNHTNK